MRPTAFICSLLLLLTLSLSTYSAKAEKVVVIPLNNNMASEYPGNFKTISISSIGAKLMGSPDSTFVGDTCGSRGQYYGGTPTSRFFYVPVQLPDGATITSFSGVFCDNTDQMAGWIALRRSDYTRIGYVQSNLYGPSTTPYKKTDTAIVEPVVDNSLYAYFIVMTAGTSAYSGVNYYPISIHITLE